MTFRSGGERSIQLSYGRRESAANTNQIDVGLNGPLGDKFRPGIEDWELLGAKSHEKLPYPP